MSKRMCNEIHVSTDIVVLTCATEHPGFWLILHHVNKKSVKGFLAPVVTVYSCMYTLLTTDADPIHQQSRLSWSCMITWQLRVCKPLCKMSKSFLVNRLPMLTLGKKSCSGAHAMTGASQVYIVHWTLASIISETMLAEIVLRLYCYWCCKMDFIHNTANC